MTENLGTIFPVVINGTNLQSGTYKNLYRYTPPSGAFTFKKGSKVCIGQIALYYSWANFSDAYANNTFSIVFSGFGTLAINIGTQSLSITDLNSYVQQIMIQNNLHLVNSAGDNVYYFEIAENSAYYGVQVNLYPVPAVLPVGWTNPGISLSGFCPQFIVPNTDFQDIIGFTAGTYGGVAAVATQSFLSSYTPQVSPVQSILVSCSLLRNYYNANPTILYTFTSAGTSFGGLIETSPNFPQFVDVYPGTYNQIDISFLDQNGNPLPMQDSNVNIALLFRVDD